MFQHQWQRARGGADALSDGVRDHGRFSPWVDGAEPLETEPPGCSLPSWLSVWSAGIVLSPLALHLGFPRLFPDRGQPLLLAVVIHFPGSKFRVYWWPLMVSFQFGCCLWVCRLMGPEMLWTAEHSQGWRNLGNLNHRGQNKWFHFLGLFTPHVFGHL